MAGNVLEDAWKAIINMDPTKVGAAIGTAAYNPSALVEEIAIDSEYTPTISIKRPVTGQSGKGGLDPILKIIRPKVTVRFADGTLAPMVVEPWGSPQSSKWPIIAGVTALSAMAIGYYFFRGVTCKCGR